MLDLYGVNTTDQKFTILFKPLRSIKTSLSLAPAHSMENKDKKANPVAQNTFDGEITTQAHVLYFGYVMQWNSLEEATAPELISGKKEARPPKSTMV